MMACNAIIEKYWGTYIIEELIKLIFVEPYFRLTFALKSEQGLDGSSSYNILHFA